MFKDKLEVPRIRYLVAGETASLEGDGSKGLFNLTLDPEPVPSVFCLGGSLKHYTDFLNFISGARELPDLHRSGSTVIAEEFRHFDTFDLELRRTGIEAYVCKSQQEVTELNDYADRKDLVVAVVKLPGSVGGHPEIKTTVLDDVNFQTLDPNSYKTTWNPLEGVRVRANTTNILTTIMHLTRHSEVFRYQADGEIKVQIAVRETTAKFPVSPHHYRFYELEVNKNGKGENVDVASVCTHLAESYGTKLLCAPEPSWVKALNLMRCEKMDIRGTAAERGAEYLTQMLAGQ